MESPVGSEFSYASTAPTLVDALEREFVDHRDELMSPDGVMISPLKVLKDLAAEHEARIDEKTFEIHLKGQIGPDSIRHRVILAVGLYKGHGEASRHRLALQLAAGDLLEKMKVDGHDEIPPYGLLPGCRVNPMVYRDLKEYCVMEELAGIPEYTQISPKSESSELSFAFKCTIGQAMTVGMSDSIFLAKRLAAKLMYEKLTGEIYPDDRIATGLGCIQMDELRIMGIHPWKSRRAQQREKEDKDRLAEEKENEMVQKKKPSKVKLTVEGDEYDEDDYAEQEDEVVCVGRKFDTLNLVAV